MQDAHNKSSKELRSAVNTAQTTSAREILRICKMAGGLTRLFLHNNLLAKVYASIIVTTNFIQFNPWMPNLQILRANCI